MFQSSKMQFVIASFCVRSSMRMVHFTNSQQSYLRKQGAPKKVQRAALVALSIINAFLEAFGRLHR
jgi:uncharacterized membrane protein SpoIIM required for sporulation